MPLGFRIKMYFRETTATNGIKIAFFELRTPKKTQEVDEQIYYEVSDHYRVLRNPLTNALEHEQLRFLHLITATPQLDFRTPLRERVAAIVFVIGNVSKA